MDKTEYNQKLEELSASVQEKDFAHALEIVDSIDWRRVKSIRTLNMAADVYERNKEYQKEREVLKIAYNHSSIGRGVLSRLVEVNLKMGDVDEAERYFREFSKVALNDNSRCLLQYKLYKAKNAPLDAQIAVLEEYREREYTERWAYELAKLYAKAGDRQKCVETCDDLILWFSEGKYVVRAMELKMRFEPLSPSQKALYSEIRETGYRKKTAAEETEQTQSSGQIREEVPQAAAASAAMSTADMDAERIARILSGEYNPEEEETAAPAETAETELPAGEEFSAEAELPADAEPAPEAEPAAEPELSGMSAFENIPAEEDSFTAEEEESTGQEGGDVPSEPVDLSGLDDEEDGEEEDEEMAADAAALRAERAGRASRGEPEAIRNRLFRSFHDVFGNLSKDDTEDRIERPEEDLEEQEPEDGADIRVRELEPEESAGSDAVSGGTQYAGMKTEDFNLDEFLSETMGSFAGELASGSFDGASTTAPSQDSGNIRFPDERSSAAENGDEADMHGAGVVAPSVEESLAALRFEFPEESGQEEQVQTIETDEAGLPAAPQIEIPEEVSVQPADLAEEAAEEPAAAEAEETKEEAKPSIYNEELEVPDPEPDEEERRSRTITLSKIGQNTVPVSLNQILDSETPEERRIRILNKARPTRMSEEQLGIFTYFARIPGMDTQILEALNGVYRHAGERTSLHGNIAVMGAVGTGKSRLSKGLIIAMCRDMGLPAAKVARISGGEMNKKDPAQVVSIMAGGFLTIEDVSLMTADTVEKLNQAMEFRTDCMVLIIEDEKSNMRAFLKKHPRFAAKFDKVISIPVFTNDELVTFARTYATENGCKMDDLGILALYTKIGNSQTEEEPVTIARVKGMVDDAIHRAGRSRRKSRRGRDRDKDKWIILHEKDFE